MEQLDPIVASAIAAVGGFLVGAFGGKVLPFLRVAAKATPTKADDAAVEVLQKLADAEATKEQK